MCPLFSEATVHFICVAWYPLYTVPFGDCVSLKVLENVFLLWLLPEIIDINEHLITTNGQSQ